MLAGLTSTGTDGAADFICSPNSLAEATKRLELSRRTLPSFFQCVLRVEANRGVDVIRVQLVAAKALHNDQRRFGTILGFLALPRFDDDMDFIIARIGEAAGGAPVWVQRDNGRNIHARQHVAFR